MRGLSSAEEKRGFASNGWNKNRHYKKGMQSCPYSKDSRWQDYNLKNLMIMITHHHVIILVTRSRLWYNFSVWPCLPRGEIAISISLLTHHHLTSALSLLLLLPHHVMPWWSIWDSRAYLFIPSCGWRKEDYQHCWRLPHRTTQLTSFQWFELQRRITCSVSRLCYWGLVNLFKSQFLVSKGAIRCFCHCC